MCFMSLNPSLLQRCFQCFPKAGINYSENAFAARRGNQWLVKAAGDKISRPASVGGQGPVNDCPRRAERTTPRRGIRPFSALKIRRNLWGCQWTADTHVRVSEGPITIVGREGKVMAQPWREASPLSMMDQWHGPMIKSQGAMAIKTFRVINLA